MGVMNLNGVERKHGIANGKTIKGRIQEGQLAVRQHAVIGFLGRTYNSPFTSSSASVFPVGRTVSTQPQLPASKVESPGVVVPVKDFTKVQPHEKGTFFNPNSAPRPVVGRVGGPSATANTPANPNAKGVPLRGTAISRRPVRRPNIDTSTKKPELSFLRSAGTMGGHPDPQAGTSSSISRWAVVKKGAVK